MSSSGNKLFFSVLILGLSSAISQVVVLREIIITFYGNEFFWGVVLASWLACVALGCKIFEVLLKKTKKEFSVLLSLHFITPFLFLAEIIFLRWGKVWLGLAGEIPNLFSTILGAAIFPLPIAFVLGGWWTVATRLLAEQKKEFTAWFTNKAYLLEILGFAAGGVLFSFFLVGLNEMLIGWFLVLFNLGFIFYLTDKKAVFWRIAAGLLCLFFIAAIFTTFPCQLNELTQSFRFKNQHLIESINSPYGNIAVSKIKTNEAEPQYNFYESGLLLGTTADCEFNEIFIHLSLLSHPRPEKVLLVGGGVTGAVSEILKHPVNEVYYLELDPKLIEIATKYLAEEIKNDLQNERVKTLSMDGRYFLEKTSQTFDVILINLPDPSTALLNRFYTKEFFQKAKEKLKEGGILATHLTYSSSAPNKDLENLNVSLQKTLKEVFPQVIILPEETNIFLASENGNLSLDPVVISERFKQREIQTNFFNEQYLRYRLQNPRLVQTAELFSKNKEARINQDGRPLAYFYNTSFWLAKFQPKLSNIFQKISREFLWFAAGFAALISIILFFTRKKQKSLYPGLSAALSGFSLLAFEIIIIFFYQTVVGYLYHRIALVLACFMAGMALGIFLINKKIAKQKSSFSTLTKTHLALAVWCLILLVLFRFLPQIQAFSVKEVLLFVYSVLSGLLGSLIFPLANSLYLSSQLQPHKKTGSIYAADLLGSCLGAVLPALILIPVFGVSVSLVVLALINLWLACLILFAKNIGSESV